MTSAMKPSFIYFDIGGVVIKDFSCSNKWLEFKRGLGIRDDQLEVFDEYWDKEIHPRVNLDMDIDTLVPVFNQKFDLHLPEHFSILHEFIIRFEPNKLLWPIIKKLSTSNIKIGLLTNMYPRMFNAIKAANLLPPVDWDVVVDSSIEQVQKPDPQIYHLAQQKAGVPHHEILFIDNTQKHLDAARQLDWQTFFYDSCDYQESTAELKKLLTYFQTHTP